MKLIEKICNLCKRLKNNKKEEEEGKSLSSSQSLLTSNLNLNRYFSFFSKLILNANSPLNISLDIFFPDNFLSIDAFVSIILNNCNECIFFIEFSCWLKKKKKKENIASRWYLSNVVIHRLLIMFRSNNGW